MNAEKKFTIPVEVEPEIKTFKLMGFTKAEKEEELAIDFYYDGWDRKRGTVLRFATSNPFTGTIANWVRYRNDEPYFVNTIAYDPKFYTPETNPVHSTQISLDQIANFMTGIDQLIHEKGIDTLDEKTIFGSDVVKKIFSEENI